MRIIGGPQQEYERVVVGQEITGVIDEAQFARNRKCRVYDPESDAWVEGMQDQVRLAFRLEGYQHRHYSRWMRASTHKKSTFYLKILKPLCPKHDCAGKEIDLDKLRGVQVKTTWEQNGVYQNLTKIRALNPSLNVIANKQDSPSTGDKEPVFDGEEPGEEGPF